MYRHSIVTFIDILGFKEIVKSRSAESIGKVLEVLRRVNKHEDFLGDDDFDPRVLQFSDSIVRVRPLSINGQSAHPNTFIGELGDLAWAQLLMLKYGVCVRGAITVGEVFVSPAGAFGPAFVRAYELEASLAKHPRIVIAPEFIAALRDASASDEEKRVVSVEQVGMNWISYGEDDVPWLDYFAWLISTEWDPENALEHHFENHREFIVGNASHRTSLDALASKYLWLARYHNSTLTKLAKAYRGGLPFDHCKLLIHPADLPLLHGTV